MDTERIEEHIDEYHTNNEYDFEALISLIGSFGELRMMADSPFIAGPVYDDMVGGTFASMILTMYAMADDADIDLDSAIEQRMDEIEEEQQFDSEAVEEAIEELDYETVFDEVFDEDTPDDSPTFQ